MSVGSRFERLPRLLRPTLAREIGLVVVLQALISLGLFWLALALAHPRALLSWDELHLLEPYLWGAAGTALAVMAGGLFAASRRVAAPVRRVRDAARAVADGALGARVHQEGLFDELGELAATFDAMAEKVQETVAHLESERDFSNALLERFPEGLAVLGPGGRIVYANPTFRWIFAGAEWERGVAVGAVLPTREAAALVEQALAARRAHLRARVDLLPPAVRSPRHLRLSVMPVGGAGAPERALLVVEDETGDVLMERQRAEWQDMLIHDVKSPLSAVLGTVKALSMDERPAEERRLLGHAEKAGERVVRLLNTYLDVLRMESGARELRLAPVQLAEAAAEAAGQAEPLAREAGLELTVDVPPEAVVRADRELLVRILGNLLDNAVKYAAGGGSAVVGARRTRGGGWRLSVADKGPGVAPADLPFVFDRFYRSKAAAAGRRSGAGLGLAFCRLAADLHGWGIRAESEPGSGAEIILEMPEGGDDAAS